MTVFAEANPEKLSFVYEEDGEDSGYILYFHDKKRNFFGAMHPLAAIDILMEQSA